MKKLTSLFCASALLLSFSSCGVEKPDIETTTAKTSEETSSSSSTSASEEDVNKFKIEDSHITTDLNERFHIDADISGYDISKVTGYGLKTPDMNEDQVANILMSDRNCEYKEMENGEKVFSNDKEILSVRYVDKTPAARYSSPALIYSLDKGKEYHSIVWSLSYGNLEKDEDMEKAEALVKDKLDKLHIEYGDFYVSRIDNDDLNDYYGISVKEQAGSEVNIIDYDANPNRAYASSFTRYDMKDPLDENFQFNTEDDCYIITGSIMYKGLSLKPSVYNNYPTIRAAVSSRGIEYLYLDQLYSTETSYGESAVIPLEQAVDSVYKAFTEKSDGDKLEVTIYSIELSYLKEYSEDSSSSTKYDLVPVWTFEYEGQYGDKHLTSYSCQVSASDGHILTDDDQLFIIQEVG